MNDQSVPLFNRVPLVRTDTCVKHGPFESRNPFGRVWTQCPRCTDELDRADRQAAAEKESQLRQAAWQRRIGEAGIPARFHDRTLENYLAETDGQKRALAFALDFANTFDRALATGRSALFIGLPGTGKTHLAAAIGLRIMERDRRTVLFATVMRAIRRIKDTWSRKSGERETDAIEALVFPDLLILDEVGIQYGSDTEKLLLFDVLNERYEKRRPTLLLSNLTLDEIKVYLGERVFDRLREDGGQAIAFDWPSHRGR